MNNFYKLCGPIKSVESNACCYFNLNLTFWFHFSTPLSLSLYLQRHWRKTAWTFRATRWTTACSTFPARVCAASAFATTPNRSGARPSTVIRPTWVNRLPSKWYLLKYFSLYSFSRQFCKNFRVGERCCEFECLDPPGEDKLYQVSTYHQQYIEHITELCAISGTYAQARRDSGGQQHRQPREGGSAGHVHHNAELSGQRSAGKLITSDDIATVIAVCVCVSSKYVYVCLLTLQSSLVPSPPHASSLFRMLSR